MPPAKGVPTRYHARTPNRRKRGASQEKEPPPLQSVAFQAMISFLLHHKCCSPTLRGHLLNLVLVPTSTEVTWLTPGAKAASDNLQSFIDRRLKGFADASNDPNEDVCSHMSAYFNMGQMSAQAAVMRVKASRRFPDGVKAFMEQAVVRRELGDNLCFYNGKRTIVCIEAHTRLRIRRCRACCCLADHFDYSATLTATYARVLERLFAYTVFGKTQFCFLVRFVGNAFKTAPTHVSGANHLKSVPHNGAFDHGLDFGYELNARATTRTMLAVLRLITVIRAHDRRQKITFSPLFST